MVENEILAMTIHHKLSDEEFLFLCNPSKKELQLTLPQDWKDKEEVFPYEKKKTANSFLSPSEYRLLVRKT
jgi:hypothetical protein